MCFYALASVGTFFIITFLGGFVIEGKVTANDDSVIQKNQTFFDFYVMLPEILSIVLAVIGVVAGFITIATECEFWIALIIWVGTALLCFVTYCGLKIAFSYKILHIYYLKKIATAKTPYKSQDETSTYNTPFTDDDDPLNIPLPDECPSCFHKISPDDEECEYCGHKLK